MTTIGPCASTFTIDRRTGEKLTCDGEHFIGGWSGTNHSAKHSDTRWYWSDREADTDA